MRTFWSVVAYTYGRKNLLHWLLLLVLPVLVALFLVYLFDARAPLHLPIGVVRQDSSPLSDKLLRALEADAAISLERICPDLPTCEEAMRNDEVLGVVVLPPGLERRALRSESPVIPVFLNGQSLVAYNTLSKEIRAAIGTVAAPLDKRNPKDPVRVVLHAIHNPALDYQAFLGTSALAAAFHLAALVVAVFLCGEPLRDRTADTLLNKAQGNALRALSGRLLPGLIWMWLLYLFFAVYIRARSGIIMGSVEFALLAFGALGMMAACMAAGMAWTSFSGNMRIASSTAAVIGGPAFAFSGITFPLLAMPWPAQIFAQALPLTHFLRMQNQLLFTEVGHAAVSTQILVLWGMALGWFLIGLPLMCRRLKQPHFHGGHREEAFS